MSISPEMTGVIIGGVIGIVSSLVAVFLSNYLQRKRDDTRFARDKRLLLAEAIIRLKSDGILDDDPRIAEMLDALDEWKGSADE